MQPLVADDHARVAFAGANNPTRAAGNDRTCRSSLQARLAAFGARPARRPRCCDDQHLPPARGNNLLSGLEPDRRRALSARRRADQPRAATAALDTVRHQAIALPSVSRRAGRSAAAGFPRRHPRAAAGARPSAPARLQRRHCCRRPVTTAQPVVGEHAERHQGVVAAERHFAKALRTPSVSPVAGGSMISISRRSRQNWEAASSTLGPTSRSRAGGGRHRKCSASTPRSANSPVPRSGEPMRWESMGGAPSSPSRCASP